MAEQYVSGNWIVTAGKEDEFIERWNDFTGWTAANVAGAKSFKLIRDMDDPTHFLSIGIWDDMDSVRAWRTSSEFAERLGACRRLCEDFHASDYSLAASHGDALS